MGRKPPQSAAVNDLIVSQVSNGIPLQQFERSTSDAYVIEALRQTNGNMCKASKRIGVHRNTLSRRCDEILACDEVAS